MLRSRSSLIRLPSAKTPKLLDKPIFSFFLRHTHVVFVVPPAKIIFTEMIAAEWRQRLDSFDARDSLLRISRHQDHETAAVRSHSECLIFRLSCSGSQELMVS